MTNSIVKAGKGKYIGVWLLWSITSNIFIEIFSKIILSSEKQVIIFLNNLWVEPIIEFSIYLFTSIAIYSFFTSLDKSRVVPYFYGFGTLGILVSLGRSIEDFETLASLGVEINTTAFYISFASSGAAALFGFHWYFVLRHKHQKPPA